MAVRHTYIAAPPEDVWAALADGDRYADWVVGTRRIRHADPDWPRVGACIEFTVGWGPVRLDDRTVVRVSVPPERLELEIKAGLFGTVRVTFALTPWGDGTVLVVDEHPLAGLGAGLHGPPGEMLLHLRNRLLLRNLKRIVHDKRADGTNLADRPGAAEPADLAAEPGDLAAAGEDALQGRQAGT
jgi:uncharacterized protein YndB with AHSA1/START domain